MKEIDRFVEEAHRMGREGLMLCSSGNMSWRVGDDLALVSGTGSWLGRIMPEQVATCRISDCRPVEGCKPSMESSFHLGVLRTRDDVNVVLHFQSEYATVVACMKEKPANFNVTAEIPAHLGSKIPVVPYYRPGSAELAEAVTEAMRGHDAVLLSKHGQVVCGADFDDVFQKAVFFEMACRIIVLAGANNYLTFTPEEVLDLEKYILGKK
jgi:ribulose-5-phosphate 4-epimerase/fuculose-1-phosphate aldolase